MFKSKCTKCLSNGNRNLVHKTKTKKMLAFSVKKYEIQKNLKVAISIQIKSIIFQKFFKILFVNLLTERRKHLQN